VAPAGEPNKSQGTVGNKMAAAACRSLGQGPNSFQFWLLLMDSAASNGE